jgi:excisionase family DNA binding protein
MVPLLSCEKAAELLGISPWTVRKWLRDNKLRAIRLGRRVLIELAEIERLIEEGRSEGDSSYVHGVRR